VDRATSSAPAAAERAARAILVYDHERLEADRRSAVGFMTDDFAEQYTDTFEKVVAPAAEQTSAKVTAEVQAGGVIRASADRARVLLFVDQTTVSSANEAPQQALNRVEMIMVREGDRWLVDDLTSY
jgi:Mce-associated membrane protein